MRSGGLPVNHLIMNFSNSEMEKLTTAPTVANTTVLVRSPELMLTITVSKVPPAVPIRVPILWPTFIALLRLWIRYCRLAHCREYTPICHQIARQRDHTSWVYIEATFESLFLFHYRFLVKPTQFF